LIDNECITLCDTGFTADEDNGACACEDIEMYFSRDWDEDTGYVTGSSCKALPNCTAGTGFLLYNYRCEHRKSCNEREIWDENKWDCVMIPSAAGCTA